MEKDNLIDIEAIIRSRKGGEKVPGFAIRLIKRLIHQDFLNGFFQYGYEGEEFCREVMKYLDIHKNVEGMENLDLIPKDQHVCVVCNHPLGGVDSVIMMDIFLPLYKGKVRMMVNDFLMAVKGIASISIPVNKIGGQAKSLSAAVHGMFDSDNEVLLFPAGLCSRKIDGVVQDREWKKTFVQESVRTDRWIIPVFFDAENSKRFYRVDWLCKKLKIKFNLPMVLLPDELYRSQHRTVRVVIGKPIDPKSLDMTKGALAVAQDIRAQVYKMR